MLRSFPGECGGGGPHGARRHHGNGRAGAQAMAGLAFCASLSAETRTAASIWAGVGGLQRNATVRAASAPIAAPKKKPDTQWKWAVPYRVPVMISAAPPPAKLPPRALNA